MTVYDTRSGENLRISRTHKGDGNLKACTLEIASHGSDSEPGDTFDRAICADGTEFLCGGQADFAICEFAPGHMKNIERAFVGISSVLKRSSIALLFVTSWHVVFSQFNLLIGKKVRRSLLFILFGYEMKSSGFSAHCPGCTPDEMLRLAESHGLGAFQVRPYFTSSCFSFSLSLYIAWLLWLPPLCSVNGGRAPTFPAAPMKV
jgi:hypothetical protein